MPKNKQKEILSSCCAFGTDGTEEVHVELSDCPIKREVGYRERSKYLSTPEGVENPIIKECSCMAYSGYLGAERYPMCPFYGGTKKVKRDQRTKYKVNCLALDPNKNPNLN